MKRTSITDAKNGLSALIEQVRHGESVIIEDRGVPVARLEFLVAPGRRGGPGSVEGRAARLQRRASCGRPSLHTQAGLDHAAADAPRRRCLSDAVIAERRDAR